MARAWLAGELPLPRGEGGGGGQGNGGVDDAPLAERPHPPRGPAVEAGPEPVHVLAERRPSLAPSFRLPEPPLIG